MQLRSIAFTSMPLLVVVALAHCGSSDTENTPVGGSGGAGGAAGQSTGGGGGSPALDGGAGTAGAAGSIVADGGAGKAGAGGSIAVDSGSDGQVVASECGALAEGKGQCTAGQGAVVCENAKLVSYECPLGTECDSDSSALEGVACFCDDVADGVCPDPECTNDHDCVAPTDAGVDGCKPLALPGPAAKILPPQAGRLPQPSELAVDGDMLYATVGYGGEAISNTRVIACPTTGCSAAPTAFGHPNISAYEMGLAAMAGKVFWTERDSASASTGSGQANVLRSANPDGTGQATVYSLFGGGSFVAEIKPSLAVDGTTLFFDAELAETSTSTSQSGLRRYVSGASDTTAVGSPAHDPLVSTRVFAASGHVAYWVEHSIVGPESDLKLHILDASTGTEQGATPPIENLYGAALDSASLFYIGSGAPSQRVAVGCRLPDCAAPVDLSVYGVTGSSLAISGPRVYFAGRVDRGCGMIDGVLASCKISEALDGTCKPTYHASGLEWINLYRLVVTPTAAFATFKTTTDLARVALQ